MNHRWATAMLVVASAAAVACKPSAKDTGREAFRPLDPGAEVPAYTAVTLAGDTLRIGGHTGPTVVNVWATWCTSCREEMTALESLKSEFGARGVRVIGVSVDQGGVAKVRRYTEANRLDFAVAHDPAGDIQRLYQVVGVPTTFVVGKDGHLVWKHTGNITDILDEVRASVRKAVGL